MSVARYKFDIYAAGQISTTGTISWTFTENRFPAGFAPTVGGQIARPTQGVVESQPWIVSLLDVGSSFTGLLANSSGRLQQIGRLARLRRSLDSTASSNYQTLAVSRIGDVALNPNVAAYDLTMSNEGWRGQQLQVFAKIDNNLSVIPGGYMKNSPWAFLPNPVWTSFVKYGRTTLLLLTDPRGKYGMTAAVGQIIANDLKPLALYAPTGSSAALAALTTGNFKHFRWRGIATSADYGIVAFGATITAPLKFHVPADIVAEVKNGWSSTNGHMNAVWVVWNTSGAAPAVGTKVTGYVHGGVVYTSTGSFAINDAGIPPSPALPLLIGGVNGLHPSEVAKNAYNGVYSPSTATQLIRYSTAAMTAWKNQSIYGRTWYRITSPALLTDWLSRRVYQPYGMIPTIDSSGKIAPQSVVAPTTVDIGNTANLLRIGSSNLAQHPTWGSQSRELVNDLDINIEQIVMDINVTASVARQAKSADIMDVYPLSARKLYDNSTRVGKRTLPIVYPQIAAPQRTTNSSGYILDLGAFTSAFSRAFFARFGDGPIYSDVTALPAIDQTTRGRINVGSYVAVKLATYPNLATNARGSTRLMQVVGRVDGPLNVSLTLLDAGALSNLATPTLTLALSSYSSRHGLKATVASLSAGGSYEIRAVPTSTGGAVPTDTSTAWRTILVGSTANLTQHYLQLASKSKWWGEVRALKPASITSPWSTARNVVTAKIAGPTSFLSTGLTGGQVGLKWKYGSSLYPIEVMVANSTSDTLGSSRAAQRLAPLSTRTVLNGLDLGVKHKLGVRHFDNYGGASTTPTLTLTPSTVSVAAPSMKGLTVVFGAP